MADIAPYKEQHRKVQVEFGRQAEPYWTGISIPQELREVLARIDVASDAVVLDVAAGTGLVSRALAFRAKDVVALDITPERLERGRAAADHDGILNIRFEQAPAEALPYPDGAFDLAITRFSLHHFARPQQVVDGMARVARGRGNVVLIDMLSPNDAAMAERFNELERRRGRCRAAAPNASMSWFSPGPCELVSNWVRISSIGREHAYR